MICNGCGTETAVFTAAEGLKRCGGCLVQELREARTCARRAMRLAHHDRLMRVREQAVGPSYVESGEWAEIRRIYPWSTAPDPEEEDEWPSTDPNPKRST